MPMPVELDAEWAPLKRYSGFEFGAPVHQYTSGVCAPLFRDEPPSDLGFCTDVRARYRCEDLDCYVETINGIVHRMKVYEACLFRGFNLIGSKVSVALSLLGVVDVDRHIPDPENPLEWIGVIPALGFEFQVMCSTDTIVEATLRPSLDEYLQRERQARRHLGGLTESLRANPASDFVSPVYQLA